jgi:hypothetical protein
VGDMASAGTSAVTSAISAALISARLAISIAASAQPYSWQIGRASGIRQDVPLFAKFCDQMTLNLAGTISQMSFRKVRTPFVNQDGPKAS